MEIQPQDFFDKYSKYLLDEEKRELLKILINVEDGEDKSEGNPFIPEKSICLITKSKSVPPNCSYMGVIITWYPTFKITNVFDDDEEIYLNDEINNLFLTYLLDLQEKIENRNTV